MADQTPPTNPPVPPNSEPEPRPAVKLAKKLATYAVMIAAAALIGYLTGQPVEVPPFPQGAAPVPPAPALVGGWVPDPEAVAAAEAQARFKTFAATPAGQSADPLPAAVYLWQTHEKVTGSPPPIKDQNPTGSCVGFGTTTAIERSLASAIFSGETTDRFTYFSEEVTYAGSRVEVNGGRCPIQRTRKNPSGDGSNGGWAATWATKFGMVPKGTYAAADLTTYSAARARAWNYTGVPDSLEPEAAKYKVGDATRCTSVDQAKRAIANGYGFAVCSDVGFNPQRDANGVATPGPEWGHCMPVDGYHTDAAGRLYFHIENQWGTIYHRGPVGWGNPTQAGFWCRAEVLAGMIAQGDTWIFSSARGFPSRNVDWFAAAPARRPVLSDLALAW